MVSFIAQLGTIPESDISVMDVCLEREAYLQTFLYLVTYAYLGSRVSLESHASLDATVFLEMVASLANLLFLGSIHLFIISAILENGAGLKGSPNLATTADLKVNVSLAFCI